MQRFKSIISVMQGHSKNNLHKLYNTRSKEELPLIFQYLGFEFWFGGTSYRTSEKLLLYVRISGKSLPGSGEDTALPYETYLLNVISPVISKLHKSYINTDKNVREKAQFETQRAGSRIIRRSGICYDAERGSYILRINFNVPLVNALSVNAKAAVRAVRDILEHIKEALDGIDPDMLKLYVTTYEYQQQIRRYMNEHDLCAFIADGSILPRENGTSEPAKNVIPFVSPPEMEVRIPLPDGGEMTGMGIKRGITVITGGGYSGKSTMLDAIEMGIYNHIPGDGREYVLTDDSALKICAEDGRPVSKLDMSPFFGYFPGNADIWEFSTLHASGSVSQAANIIEAVCGKCKLLLIDEDRSANNFMMRDVNMRRIVRKEPIIPFTDRVKELYDTKGVSAILVVGGSCEYLSLADNVILTEDYLPKVVTEDVRGMELPKHEAFEQEARWTSSRILESEENSREFRYFLNVATEDRKRIILDEYSSDITLLTAVVSEEQMNTLARAVKCLLADKEAGSRELIALAEEYTGHMPGAADTNLMFPEAAQRFYEDVRPLDVFGCMNRMRGICFKSIGR